MRHPRVVVVLYITAALISLLGLADSIYLTVQHLTGQNVDCIASSGCETVLTSGYAGIGKVPLAFFGAVAYFGVFSLATLGSFGHAHARSLLLLLVAMMLGVTCWLFYLQAFVLHAFCDFCLLSAAFILLLFLIAAALFFLDRPDQLVRDSQIGFGKLQPQTKIISDFSFQHSNWFKC